MISNRTTKICILSSPWERSPFLRQQPSSRYANGVDDRQLRLYARSHKFSFSTYGLKARENLATTAIHRSKTLVTVLEVLHEEVLEILAYPLRSLCEMHVNTTGRQNPT